MTTRSEREKALKLNDQHQVILSKMLREDDNKYCADCEAKGAVLCGVLWCGVLRAPTHFESPLRPEFCVQLTVVANADSLDV